MSPRSAKQFKDIRKQKTELIMETALELFAENGFHATSMSQIAKKAGISKGLAYNYFENGEIAYLFGDNVRLRTEPNSTSETITFLKIGEQIEIIEKTNVKNIFKGIESPWYKVKYGKKIGYILGGLISLTERKIDNIRCFVTLEKIESKIYILTRVISDSKTSYFENKSESHSENGGFCLKIFDNKGLEGISNIIFINYLPESCGANSGGYYLFFDKKKLHKVIDVTSSGDVGIWESENLYFPKDSLGIKNRIIYIKEKGEYSESETNETEPDWEKSSKIKIKLEWINNKLSPEPKTFANTVYN